VLFEKNSRITGPLQIWQTNSFVTNRTFLANKNLVSCDNYINICVRNYAI